MAFLKNIFRRKKEHSKEVFFGASDYEMRNIIFRIGESEIWESQIRISKYPFEPSSVFPEKIIKADEITAISWDSYPPLLQLENEVVFISREHSELLKQFQIRNGIAYFKASKNWDWLLEPYVDTEYTVETDLRLTNLLAENGINKDEIEK